MSMNNITSRRLLKYAQDLDGRYSVNQYMPLGKYRDLSEEELAEIESKSSRLLPKIWRNESTPIVETLSSPKKQAIINFLLGGTVGAAGGAALLSGGSQGGALIGAGAGATLLGSALAALGYYSKKNENEGIIDYMKRLPPNARMRDLEADPVYQKKMDRQALMAAAASRSY